ncbi:MAG: hypothetical protein ACRDCT_17270 [Shewanella sp.]
MPAKGTKPTSPNILPRQLTLEAITALRQDMRRRYIDNMKALETMDLSHLEQDVPTQR